MSQISLEAVNQNLTQSLADLTELYRNGQVDTVLELTEEPAQRIGVLRAWCHYRNKNFDTAAEELTRVPESQGSLTLQAYLAAYVEAHKDEAKLLAILPKLSPDNIDGLNALTIAARNADSTIPAEAVWEKAAPFIEGLQPEEATTSAANLLHNLGRLALAREEYPRALEYLDRAIEAYSEETNHHHRGAAHFWRSDAYEKQGMNAEAWEAARDSLAAWKAQLDAEPTNETWKTRFAGAVAREQELALK